MEDVSDSHNQDRSKIFADGLREPELGLTKRSSSPSPCLVPAVKQAVRH